MEIPPRFKPVTPYIRRAEKLDRSEEPEAPVVAYYCRLYAVDQAFKLQDSSEPSKVFLSAMITRLEEDKKRGLTNFTEEESKKMCMDWAMKEFNVADEEDRADFADQDTARAFYAAGVFFDVLRQFGPADEETSKRRLYCKWKASQILKAIKEGRTPTPGGVGEEAPPAPAPSGPAAVPSPEEQKTAGGGHGSVVPEAPSHAPSPYIPPTSVDPMQPPMGTTELSSAPTIDSGGGGSLYPTGVSGPPTSSTYMAPYPPSGPVPAANPYVDPASAPYVVPAPAPYVAPVPSPYVPQGGVRGEEPMDETISGPMDCCNTAIKALGVKEIGVATQELNRALNLCPPPRPQMPSSRRGNHKPSDDNMKDAVEFAVFAIRALEFKEFDLAKQKITESLRQVV